MTDKQKIAQIEQTLGDYGFKQNYIYEEVLILKGNLDRTNRAFGNLIEVSRIMNGDVTYMLRKTNVIADKITEIDERLERVEEDVSQLKTNVAQLQTDVAKLQTNVAEIQTDVDEIKTDVAGIQTNVDEIKIDVTEIKTDMKDMKGLLFKILEKVDK